MTDSFTNFAPLAERYDTFIVDQFGVLMDGAGTNPFAAEALTELVRRGESRRSAPTPDMIALTATGPLFGPDHVAQLYQELRGAA